VKQPEGPNKWASSEHANVNLGHVPGEGNVPLADLRIRYVAELEAAETAYIEAQERLMEEQENLRKAAQHRDAAYEQRQEARRLLSDARGRLVRMFPLPPDDPYPKDPDASDRSGWAT
jgi:hypothetical protein